MSLAVSTASRRRERGITLIGLLFWAIVLGFVALVGMKVFPTLNEYFTIQRTINKLAKEGGTTVQEVRTAFDRQKDIEYAITSIAGKDLGVTKENDKIVIDFAYEKEVELMDPVYLLLKYQGRSQ
jgi:hypothetical protein